MPIYIEEAVGNDTIDRYPLFCEEIRKIICVKEGIFKRIQKDFRSFLKDNKVSCKPRSKMIKNPKIKSNKTIIMPQSNFEPSNFSDSLNHAYNHRKGRMNDWHNTYGQGMYD